MRIVEPNVIELKQVDMFKHIEIVGRTCYKSEDRITEDSYIKFVNMLREHAHGAMLEHGTVYLTIPLDDVIEWDSCPMSTTGKWKELLKYSMLDTLVTHTKSVYSKELSSYCMTSNYRVIVENNLENFMKKYQSECTEYHPKRRTFKITCNRGVSHEFVRHRVFSFAQESQRYVNYSKEKFGKEIKVIKPLYFNDEFSLKYLHWKGACEDAERRYFTLLANNATPQEAREVLPNATATELVMTGFESDWEHFFKLRCAKDAHPQAQEVANKIKELF